jgi:hypothetical protein
MSKLKYNNIKPVKLKSPDKIDNQEFLSLSILYERVGVELIHAKFRSTYDHPEHYKWLLSQNNSVVYEFTDEDFIEHSKKRGFIK